MNEKLKEETHQREKEQEAKASLEKELMALLEQMETAKADVVTEFKALHPFIDLCAVYYGNRFEDCLKQVKSVYPHLDLSKVTMDYPLPSTPAGDTIFEEIDYSTQFEQDPNDDGVVLAQPAMEKPATPLIPSNEAQDVENPSTHDAQDLPFRDDENLQDAPTALV